MPKYSKRLHEVTVDDTPGVSAMPPDHTQIQALAYWLWLERGSPVGSPEVDWYRAEEELRTGKRSTGVAA